MIKLLSTIRRKIILSILAVFCGALCIFGLAACASTPEDLYKTELSESGWTIDVLFDYQGGRAKESSYINIFLKPELKEIEGEFDENGEPLTRYESRIPNPSSSGNNLGLPWRTGYSFKYYSEAKKDENGEYIRLIRNDETGEYEEDVDGKLGDFSIIDFKDGKFKYVPSDEPYDFTTVRTAEREQVVLCAQWWDNLTITLNYGDNVKKTTSVGRLQNGEPDIATVTSSAYAIDGYTVLDYYTDSAKTQKLDYALVSGNRLNLSLDMFTSENGRNFDIYCDTLVGSYVVLRTPVDITRVTSNSNVYVYDNLDFSDYSGTVILPNDYSGTFDGNNKTITGLELTKQIAATDSSQFVYCGIFGTIKSGAVVKNLTFVDVKYKVICSSPRVGHVDIGLLSGAVERGGTVDNVKVSGSLEYELSPGVTNLDNIYVNELVGSDDGSVTNSSAVDVSIVRSVVAYAPRTVNGVTENQYYAVYVKYTDTVDNADSINVYGIAAKTSSSYYAINISEVTHNEDGTYTLTNIGLGGRKYLYTVTLTNSGGAFSATVVETEIRA